MESPDTLAQVTNWAGVVLTIWKDVWGYMATTGIGLLIGIFLPQAKLPFRKKAAEG